MEEQNNAHSTQRKAAPTTPKIAPTPNTEVAIIRSALLEWVAVEAAAVPVALYDKFRQ